MGNLNVNLLKYFLIASSLILSACGQQDLSRSAAEGPIKNWLAEKKSFRSFNLTYDASSKWLTDPNNPEPPSGKQIILQRMPALSALIEEGVITPLKYTIQQNDAMGYPRWFDYYETSLTQKGMTFCTKGYSCASGGVGQSVFVDTAERVLDSITGISKSSDGRASIVQFRWVEKATPFGKALSTIRNTPFEGTAIFWLFDDGWRLQSVH